MSKKKSWYFLAAVVGALVVAMVSFAVPNPTSAVAGEENGYYGKKAKYVFYFIGDGMAMPQINSTEIFKGTLSSSDPMYKEKLSFTVFPHQGMQTTHSTSSFITDSAAAGTALASGHKTANDVLGVDPANKIKYKSMAEMAKEKGMKVGIVSSVSLDHATPAVFYAHEASRNNFYEIALSMSDSGFDYFAGGGLLAPTGKKKDRPDALEIAKQKGYKVVNNQNEIMNLSRNDGKVIAIQPGLANEEAMQYEIDRTHQLSLADFTKKGIELLDNPNGFFMMVEGGKVDWACHANDAATTIRDIMAFDNAIAEALKFYAKHPNETLIVVTGDHETGGMSVGFSGTKYETFYNKINKQTMSFEELDKKIKAYRGIVGENGANLQDWLPILAKDFGLTELTAYDQQRLADALAQSMLDAKKRTKDEKSYLLYGGYEPFSMTVTHILNQKAGIGWTTYAHTGVAIPVFAQGTGGEMFQGYYDNTDIAKKMMSIMGVKFQ